MSDKFFGTPRILRAVPPTSPWSPCIRPDPFPFKITYGYVAEVPWSFPAVLSTLSAELKLKLKTPNFIIS